MNSGKFVILSILIGLVSSPTLGQALHTQDFSAPIAFGSGTSVSTFSANGSLSLANNATLTLTGPNATVVTGSSVTASSFYGDGTNLTGVVPTYTSSMTVINSSTTSSLSFPGLCIPGSTITVTTGGKLGTLTFTGAISASGTAAAPGMAFMLDGAYINNASATTSNCEYIVGGVTADNFTCKIFLLTTPAAGSHSFCMQVRKRTTNTQTGTIGGSNTAIPFSYFYYEEWK